jgi:hypothetical protein
MHQRRPRRTVLIALGALAMALPLLVIATNSADAAVTTSGCSSAVTPGGQISHYPAWGGTQSGVRAACIFSHDTTNGNDVSASFTLHDFTSAVWHNGAARTITNTAQINSGTSTFTATNCSGITAWINRPITRLDANGAPITTGVGARNFVKSISGACLVTLDKAVTANVPANTNFKLDNSQSRSVTDGVTTNGSTTITSATANFDATDVGLEVSGTNIVPGSTIASVTPPNTAVLTTAADASGVAQTLTIGGSLESSTTRTMNDTTINQASPCRVNSPAAKWKASDVGLPVYGAGIPANSYIVSIATANATLSTSGCTLDPVAKQRTAGDPSATAAADGDVVLNQGVQLDLDPSLVAGTRTCADENPEGFQIVGTWLNPGGFFTGALGFANQPANTKAIGEILFKTSVVTYGAYVVEIPALSADPVNSAAHYDVVFPNVPTGLALCPITATSPGLGFSMGITASTDTISGLPQGVGKPGTAQLRAIRDNNSTGYTESIFLRSDAGPTWNFSRLCSTPAGPASVDFKCGTG